MRLATAKLHKILRLSAIEIRIMLKSDHFSQKSCLRSIEYCSFCVNWNHRVSTDYFSHSQHNSRVDVQLTAQFSTYFQRGLVGTRVGQYVNAARFFVKIHIYKQLCSFTDDFVRKYSRSTLS